MNVLKRPSGSSFSSFSAHQPKWSLNNLGDDDFVDTSNLFIEDWSQFSSRQSLSKDQTWAINPDMGGVAKPKPKQQAQPQTLNGPKGQNSQNPGLPLLNLLSPNHLPLLSNRDPLDRLYHSIYSMNMAENYIYRKWHLYESIHVDLFNLGHPEKLSDGVTSTNNGLIFDRMITFDRNDWYQTSKQHVAARIAVNAMSEYERRASQGMNVGRGDYDDLDPLAAHHNAFLVNPMETLVNVQSSEITTTSPSSLPPLSPNTPSNHTPSRSQSRQESSSTSSSIPPRQLSQDPPIQLPFGLNAYNQPSYDGYQWLRNFNCYSERNIRVNLTEINFSPSFLKELGISHSTASSNRKQEILVLTDLIPCTKLPEVSVSRMWSPNCNFESNPICPHGRDIISKLSQFGSPTDDFYASQLIDASNANNRLEIFDPLEGKVPLWVILAPIFITLGILLAIGALWYICRRRLQRANDMRFGYSGAMGGDGNPNNNNINNNNNKSHGSRVGERSQQPVERDPRLLQEVFPFPPTNRDGGALSTTVAAIVPIAPTTDQNQPQNRSRTDSLTLGLIPQTESPSNSQLRQDLDQNQFLVGGMGMSQVHEIHAAGDVSDLAATGAMTQTTLLTSVSSSPEIIILGSNTGTNNILNNLDGKNERWIGSENIHTFSAPTSLVAEQTHYEQYHGNTNPIIPPHPSFFSKRPAVVDLHLQPLVSNSTPQGVHDYDELNGNRIDVDKPPSLDRAERDVVALTTTESNSHLLATTTTTNNVPPSTNPLTHKSNPLSHPSHSDSSRNNNANQQIDPIPKHNSNPNQPTLLIPKHNSNIRGRTDGFGHLHEQNDGASTSTMSGHQHSVPTSNHQPSHSRDNNNNHHSSHQITSSVSSPPRLQHLSQPHSQHGSQDHSSQYSQTDVHNHGTHHTPSPPRPKSSSHHKSRHDHDHHHDNHHNEPKMVVLSPNPPSSSLVSTSHFAQHSHSSQSTTTRLNQHFLPNVTSDLHDSGVHSNNTSFNLSQSQNHLHIPHSLFHHSSSHVNPSHFLTFRNQPQSSSINPSLPLSHISSHNHDSHPMSNVSLPSIPTISNAPLPSIRSIPTVSNAPTFNSQGHVITMYHDNPRTEHISNHIAHTNNAISQRSQLESSGAQVGDGLPPHPSQTRVNNDYIGYNRPHITTSNAPRSITANDNIHPLHGPNNLPPNPPNRSDPSESQSNNQQQFLNQVRTRFKPRSRTNLHATTTTTNTIKQPVANLEDDLKDAIEMGDQTREAK